MPRTRTSRTSGKAAAKHLLWYAYSWSAHTSSFLLIPVAVLACIIIIYGDLKKLAYENYLSNLRYIDY